MKKYKSKTFQKGDDYGEVIEWFMKQLETHDYTPEGTSSYVGGLAPYDPVCELKFRYSITICKTENK